MFQSKISRPKIMDFHNFYDNSIHTLSIISQAIFVDFKNSQKSWFFKKILLKNPKPKIRDF